MKKLFASVAYSFDNFYNNLNIQGQMIFSIIMCLILLLCFLLFIMYVVQEINKKIQYKKLLNKETNVKINADVIEPKKEEIKEEKEPLYTNEKTEIEDIASAISDALKEDKPIDLTNFEEDQERTAIISIEELMDKAKELNIVEDEETGINYLEKYNLEQSEVDEALKSTIKFEEPKKEVKAFKVSQVISPIYGVRKDIVNENEKEA